MRDEWAFAQCAKCAQFAGQWADIASAPKKVTKRKKGKYSAEALYQDELLDQTVSSSILHQEDSADSDLVSYPKFNIIPSISISPKKAGVTAYAVTADSLQGYFVTSVQVRGNAS
jgi:hypothetical protein